MISLKKSDIRKDNRSKGVFVITLFGIQNFFFVNRLNVPWRAILYDTDDKVIGQIDVFGRADLTNILEKIQQALNWNAPMRRQFIINVLEKRSKSS